MCLQRLRPRVPRVASARASGCRRQRSTRSARPTMMPACGPPNSLSPLNVTRSAPASIVWIAAGSPASHAGRPTIEPRRRRVDETAADVDDDRYPERGQFRHRCRLDESVDPVVARVDLEHRARRRRRPGRWHAGSRRGGCGSSSRRRSGGRRTAPSPRERGTTRRSPRSRRGSPERPSRRRARRARAAPPPRCC